jgi:predicted Zn-dependent protease
MMNNWKRAGMAVMMAGIFMLASACNLIETRRDDASAPNAGQQVDRAEEEVGINVGEMSAIRTIVPAKELENSASKEYREILSKAKAKDALAPASDPQARRLNTIAGRIIPFAKRFNPEAENWKWEINLIRSKEINAFCMPGGKIVFYSGLGDTLKASDDELAIVMGHEMAHALREHARAQIAKSKATSLGANLLGILVSGGKYANVFDFAGNLLTLKFSRDDEREADLVGIDLAARAGYDPRAGISLWQKMETASQSSLSFSWISTHPSSADRISEIEMNLPRVMPLYEEAQAKMRAAAAPKGRRVVVPRTPPAAALDKK